MTIIEFIKSNAHTLGLYRQIELVDAIIGRKFFKNTKELLEYVQNTYIDKETSVFGEQINIYTYVIYIYWRRVTSDSLFSS